MIIDKSTNNIDELMEVIKQSGLTIDDTLNIVAYLLDAEFSTPRLQKDTDLRTNKLCEMIADLLVKYFLPNRAVSFCSELSINVMKKNPEIFAMQMERLGQQMPVITDEEEEEEEGTVVVNKRDNSYVS